MRDTFYTKYAKHMTNELKWDALQSLMFLKVKIDGRVNGQTCTDGQKNAKRR